MNIDSKKTDNHASLGSVSGSALKCAICEKKIEAFEVCEECSKHNNPFDLDSDKHQYLGGSRI